MKTKRTYIIKYTTIFNDAYYIKDLVKYDLGYRFHSTKNIESALIWKNKSIYTIVEKLNRGLFQPGFDKNTCSSHTYSVIETTPLKTLRLLKLKKLK